MKGLHRGETKNLKMTHDLGVGMNKMHVTDNLETKKKRVSSVLPKPRKALQLLLKFLSSILPLHPRLQTYFSILPLCRLGHHNFCLANSALVLL